MKETVNVDYEKLMTNLVMAENMLEKAKKSLFYGDIGDNEVQMDKDDYNFALKFASKFILESIIENHWYDGLQARFFISKRSSKCVDFLARCYIINIES